MLNPVAHMDSQAFVGAPAFDYISFLPVKVGQYQCDQIGRFIGLWARF